MILLDAKDVAAAREGNRTALDSIVRAAEKPIFNLALRMLAHPQDAEDATQEILVKIVTNLGSVRDDGAAGGWAMRIACRHLVNTSKKSRIESMRMTFEGFAEDLESGLTDLPKSEMDNVETAAAIEEVKFGCTLAMLTCLTRKLRITYVLGDVLELSDAEASSILEIEPATYRQRLRRSRAAVSEFVLSRCGNASTSANCRCERRVSAAVASGRVEKGRTQYDYAVRNREDVHEIRRYVRSLDQGRRAAALFRSNPEFETDVSDLVIKTIGAERTTNKPES